MDLVRIGGVEVDRNEASAYARRYLTDGSGWGYPSYDGYEHATALEPLTDADFLAPVLLNVNRMKIKTYEALQGKRAELDAGLAKIPADLDLAAAETADLAVLGDLFSVLDDSGGVWGARGTVLAKVLHRKRPHFIPLYDERVRTVYQGGPDAPVPPAPSGTHRSWRDFVVLFAGAVQEDLRRESDLWAEITAMASGPPHHSAASPGHRRVVGRAP